MRRVRPGDTAVGLGRTGETEGFADSVVNVAGIYAALRDDIATGRHTAPGFEDATQLAHLTDDLPAAANTGSTVTLTIHKP